MCTTNMQISVICAHAYFDMYLFVKVSMIRHGLGAGMNLICLPGCVHMLCLGMLVYAIVCMFMGVQDHACECVLGKPSST